MESGKVKRAFISLRGLNRLTNAIGEKLAIKEKKKKKASVLITGDVKALWSYGRQLKV